MTVLSPLTDKDYEGLRRVLRSLQVRTRIAAKWSLFTVRTYWVRLGRGLIYSCFVKENSKALLVKNASLSAASSIGIIAEEYLQQLVCRCWVGKTKQSLQWKLLKEASLLKVPKSRALAWLDRMQRCDFLCSLSGTVTSRAGISHCFPFWGPATGSWTLRFEISASHQMRGSYLSR